MKQLLLSTVILFGTFGSINAAAEFKGGEEGTELTEMGEVARGGAAVSATAVALAAAGAGAPIAVDYRRRLKELFVNLDEVHPIINGEALDATHDSIIEATSRHTVNTFEREKDAEVVIKCYFNEVIDYAPFSWGSYASLPNLSILGTLTGAHILLIAAGNVYPALAPLTGGLTLASINLLTTGVSLYIKDYGWPQTIAFSACCRRTPQRAIQERWQERLSNPEVKACLAKMLSYILVSQNMDVSEGNIHRRLDALLLEADGFKELFEALFPEYAAGNRV